MRPRFRSVLTFSITASLMALSVGCEDEKPAKNKIVPRETIGKTTDNVLDLKAELAKGGKTTDNKVKGGDYLTVVTDVRRKALGDIAKLAVQQRIGMYEALNDGQKPKTYEEFMEKIVKKGTSEAMPLPMLPYYQEYAYDSDTQELVIIEYPAKKAGYEKQEDPLEAGSSPWLETPQEGRIAMPSPFPGMDPFLERPDVFPDVHDSFITYLREHLQGSLPSPYYAAIGRSDWIELAHDEFREPFIEVYTNDEQGKRLVTSVELLSLSNKTPGAHGRDLYLRKQKEILASQVHLVEIDPGEEASMRPPSRSTTHTPRVDHSTITSRSISSTISNHTSSTGSAWKTACRRSPFRSYLAIRRSPQSSGGLRSLLRRRAVCARDRLRDGSAGSSLAVRATGLGHARLEG